MTATTINRDRVSQGLDLVRAALGRYLPAQLERQHGKEWWKAGVVYASNAPTWRPPVVGDAETFRASLDLAAMLTVMERNWSQVFYAQLSPQAKNYLYLTRDARNGWAHHTGGDDVPAHDANFWLGGMERLLQEIGAPEAARVEALATAVATPEPPPPPPAPSLSPSPGAGKGGKPAVGKPRLPGLVAGSSKPWREVVQPHSDVREGRLLEAEFVVNLADVLAGKAEFGYQDAASFFDRTYLTAGLRELLVDAIRRLAGLGGVPVVQLKTAFGGGKTHTMLALYHLARAGANAARLPGLAPLFADAGVDPAAFEGAQVAVLVGTALDANRSHLDAGGNGIEVRTLWGELATQLAGQAGYDLVAEADRNGRSPGSDTLAELFELAGPSLVLVDELVAYARNLVGRDDLPGGTFDAVMTFVQALTEAAKRSPRTLLVASIPESETEFGDQAGRRAQERLEHTFGRLEAIWRPVTPAEGFEIVRRRLFGEVADPLARDATCREFAKLYHDGQSGDFPAETAAPSYLDELVRAYPVHPEVFQQLYETWSTLDRFQRTRGVLRLMATVVHELWSRGDGSHLIMPGTLPLDSPKVRNEFLRYLPQQWEAVVDHDVDGPSSEPARIDNRNGRLGQHQATRRAARTIFLASAPNVAEQGVRGVEVARIRLGALEPGIPLHLAAEAVGQLAEEATYLYGGHGRWWYDTRPNLNRTADARAAQVPGHEVLAETRRRLAAAGGGRGPQENPFGGVHVFPTAADVPDDDHVRLVVLPPAAPHDGRGSLAARQAATAVLESRGNTPRHRRNLLVFAAADREGVERLDQAVRQFLAWKEIEARKDELNLDTHGRRQAQDNLARWGQTLDARLQETYLWLLVPQQEPAGPWEFDVHRIGGQEGLVRRAAASLRANGQLVETLSPKVLRMAVDRWFWKEGQPGADLDLRTLWDAYANYGYLDRLRDPQVLREAVAAGVRHPDFFGYAAGRGADGRYEGLVFDESFAADRVVLDGQSLLVRPEVAREQLAGPGPAGATEATGETGPTGATEATRPGPGPTGTRPDPARVLRRFHATAAVQAQRPIPAFAQLVEEVVQHLQAQDGATVTLELEITAHAPAGFADDVVRTVRANAATLKFKGAEFEET